MEIQKTCGITLSSIRIGEADCITKILTRDYGKREFVFKGIKKTKKRSLSISEPGTVSNLMYYFHEEKNLFVVNEFQIITDCLKIRENLTSILLLMFITEIVEKTSSTNDNTVHNTYNFLLSGIKILPEIKFAEHYALFFILHLLRHNGLLHEYSKCKICENQIQKYLFIDIDDLYPYCFNCKNLSANYKQFSHLTLDFLLKAQNTKFIMLNHSQYKTNEIISLLYHFTYFIENYYQINILSKNLLFNEFTTINNITI